MGNNRIRTRIAVGAVGTVLTLASLTQGAVANAKPNNGGWEIGYLACIANRPPDADPWGWAMACCAANGGHPTSDGTCLPPDYRPPRPSAAEILQPATVAPIQSASGSP